MLTAALAMASSDRAIDADCAGISRVNETFPEKSSAQFAFASSSLRWHSAAFQA
jgi:hypothetical protein